MSVICLCMQIVVKEERCQQMILLSSILWTKKVCTTEDIVNKVILSLSLSLSLSTRTLIGRVWQERTIVVKPVGAIGYGFSLSGQQPVFVDSVVEGGPAHQVIYISIQCEVMTVVHVLCEVMTVVHVLCEVMTVVHVLSEVMTVVHVLCEVMTVVHVLCEVMTVVHVLCEVMTVVHVLCEVMTVVHVLCEVMTVVHVFYLGKEHHSS